MTKLNKDEVIKFAKTIETWKGDRRIGSYSLWKYHSAPVHSYSLNGIKNGFDLELKAKHVLGGDQSSGSSEITLKKGEDVLFHNSVDYRDYDLNDLARDKYAIILRKKKKIYWGETLETKKKMGLPDDLDVKQSIKLEHVLQYAATISDWQINNLHNKDKKDGGFVHLCITKINDLSIQLSYANYNQHRGCLEYYPNSEFFLEAKLYNNECDLFEYTHLEPKKITTQEGKDLQELILNLISKDKNKKIKEEKLNKLRLEEKKQREKEEEQKKQEEEKKKFNNKMHEIRKELELI